MNDLETICKLHDTFDIHQYVEFIIDLSDDDLLRYVFTIEFSKQLDIIFNTKVRTRSLLKLLARRNPNLCRDLLLWMCDLHMELIQKLKDGGIDL